MNIIIYTVVILVIIYFLLRFIANTSFKKISKNLRYLLIILLLLLAVLFALVGKYLLSFPLTLVSLALVKLKGLSIFQIITLFRLIKNLKNSGRFSFYKKNNAYNNSDLSIKEACKILNLNINKPITKEDVNKAYIKIQKKIHPDISPETARLSSIVNEAKDTLLKEIK